MSMIDQIAPTAAPAAHMTRARIIEVAERSFREIGYQKTTVADIAKTLKMSPANVYRFFESKKAINEAVLERLTAEIEELISTIADTPGLSASDRLSKIISALYRHCADRCEISPRIHEMVEAAMAESWEACLRHVQRICAVLERVLVDGVRRGEFGMDDPALAARCVHTAILRYVHPVLVAPCPTKPLVPVEEMIAFLLGGLRPA